MRVLPLRASASLATAAAAALLLTGCHGSGSSSTNPSSQANDTSVTMHVTTHDRGNGSFRATADTSCPKGYKGSDKFLTVTVSAPKNAQLFGSVPVAVNEKYSPSLVEYNDDQPRKSTIEVNGKKKDVTTFKVTISCLLPESFVNVIAVSMPDGKVIWATYVTPTE